MEFYEPEPDIHYHFVRSAGVWQYLVADPVTKRAVIIDPVLDQAYDPASGPVSTNAADELLEIIKNKHYCIDRVLETHALPENLSSTWYLRTQLRERFNHTPRVCAGKSLTFVSRFFARNGVHDASWAENFDDEFSDGQSLPLGALRIQVIQLPSTSPGHVGYRIGHNLIIGDSIFHPKAEVARGCMPDEVAATVMTSLQKLVRLSSDYRIYVGEPRQASKGLEELGDNTPLAFKAG